mgnify:CR=1 FL=1
MQHSVTLSADQGEDIADGTSTPVSEGLAGLVRPDSDSDVSAFRGSASGHATATGTGTGSGNGTGTGTGTEGATDPTIARAAGGLGGQAVAAGSGCGSGVGHAMDAGAADSPVYHVHFGPEVRATAGEGGHGGGSANGAGTTPSPQETCCTTLAMEARRTQSAVRALAERQASLEASVQQIAGSIQRLTSMLRSPRGPVPSLKLQRD